MLDALVTVRPHGMKIKARAGENLMDVLRRAGVKMDFPCGGCGACGKCRVKIISKAEPPKEEEIKQIPESELKEGIRLACLFKVNSDVELEVAFKEEEAKVLEQGIMTSFDIDPPVKKRRFLIESSLKTLPLEDQLTRAVGFPIEPECRLEVLRLLSRRSSEEGTAVIKNGRIVGIEDGDTTGEIYGAAIDIGTTTVVLSLIDMITGKELAVVSALNPQKEFGYSLKFPEGDRS
jgi:uncharacterized 2Fe-2S/4Fe-4S cluster protein (DUF4445 family)